jgi:O-antigen/teichoic acid export membrane protein
MITANLNPDSIATPRTQGPTTLKVAHQSSQVFVAQLVGLVCGLVNNFIIAWLLGPEGKASVYLVQFASSTSVVFLNLGLGPAAVFQLGRGRQASRAHIASTIFWVSLIIGSLPLLTYVFAHHWVSVLVGGKMDSTLLSITVIAIPGMTLMWNAGYLALSSGTISEFNITRTAYSAAFTVCLLAAMILGRVGVHVVAWLFLGSITVPAAYAAFLVVQAGGPWTLGSLHTLTKTLRFGWHSHLGAATQFLQHRIDVILLSYFLPLREVGLFSLSVAIAELLWYLPQTIATVLLPHIADSSPEDANRLTSTFCRVCVLLTAVLSVGLGVVSSVFIRRALPAFAASIPVLWILLPGTVIATVFKVLSSDLNGRGKPLETVRPAAVALCVCFFGGVLLIPRFGMLGSAALTSIGYLINTILYLRIYLRIAHVQASRLLIPDRRDFLAINRLCRSALAGALK